MYQTISKHGLLISFLSCVAIFVIAGILYYSKGSTGPANDVLLYVSYGLFFVAVAASVILPLLHSLQNPKSLIKSGISLGGILLTYFIAFSSSAGEVSAEFAKIGITSGVVKFSDAIIVTTWVLLAATVLAVVLSEIRNSLR